jgi:hypothetical protein
MVRIISSMGFNTSNSKEKDFAKQINYGESFDVQRSTVNQKI